MQTDTIAAHKTTLNIDQGANDYPVITDKEVAIILRTSVSTVMELTEEGKLPRPIVSASPKWPLSEVLDYVRTHAQEHLSDGQQSDALPRAVTLDEFANALGISHNTLRSRRRLGLVPPSSDSGNGRRVTWPRPLVELFLRGESANRRPQRGRPPQWGNRWAG